VLKLTFLFVGVDVNHATSPATGGALPGVPPFGVQFAAVLKSELVVPFQSVRPSTGIGAGVGDFFDPLTVGAGVGLVDGLGVALGDTVAEGAGLGDGEGLAVGVGEGLGALSAEEAASRNAPQRNRARLRRKISLFISKPRREERRMTLLLEKRVNEITRIFANSYSPQSFSENERIRSKRSAVRS
jgi:hypothetical protein